jgi:hypothetical protein
MTKLEALSLTKKKFTNLLDNNVFNNTSVIDIIIYYEHLLETNSAEFKYMSGIESNFIEEELSEADYWDGDDSQTF